MLLLSDLPPARVYPNKAGRTLLRTILWLKRSGCSDSSETRYNHEPQTSCGAAEVCPNVSHKSPGAADTTITTSVCDNNNFTVQRTYLSRRSLKAAFVFSPTFQNSCLAAAPDFFSRLCLPAGGPRHQAQHPREHPTELRAHVSPPLL